MPLFTKHVLIMKSTQRNCRCQFTALSECHSRHNYSYLNYRPVITFTRSISLCYARRVIYIFSIHLYKWLCIAILCHICMFSFELSRCGNDHNKHSEHSSFNVWVVLSAKSKRKTKLKVVFFRHCNNKQHKIARQMTINFSISKWNFQLYEKNVGKVRIINIMN